MKLSAMTYEVLMTDKSLKLLYYIQNCTNPLAARIKKLSIKILHNFSRPTVLTGLFGVPSWPKSSKSRTPFLVRAMASRLSLAAKLYSIFALFAVLTAAITALSDYNTRQNADLTEAVATASRAALNVERVNSLVYAVVMESRGVYMSTEPAVVKKYGDGLLKFNEQILEVVKNWEALVQADDAEQFATFKKRIEQFVEFRKELVRRGVEINAAAGREWGDNDANREVRSALNKDLEALSKVYAERSKQLAQQADTNHTHGLCADLPRRPRAGRGRASAS